MKILLIVLLVTFILFFNTEVVRGPIEPSEDALLIYSGNSVRANLSPSYQTIEEINLEKLLQEIIKRESGGDPKACNKEFGCRAGMGLVQLIPGTVRYCEEKLEKEIDPFNPVHNLECARWLLKNEGIRHWEPYSGPYNL